MGTDLPQQLAQHLTATMLCVPRIYAMSVFVPFLRSQFLPGAARNAMLLTLAVYVSPTVVPDVQQLAADGSGFIVLVAKEAFIGIIMGFVVGLSFAVPQIIGDFIDNQQGTSISQVFNPAQGGEASQLGTLLSLMITAMFLLGGGFVLLLDMLLSSYRVIGVKEMIPTGDAARIAEGVAAIFSDLILLGVLLAAPIVFVMLLTELGLGLVGRFVQQLQVFFLAMPVKSAVALALMIVYINIVLRVYQSRGLPLEPLRQLLRVFGDG